VVSCDNVPDNGVVARDAVVCFARLRDERLADWIERHGAFPSTMVDRITPQTTPADRAMVERAFGVRDRCPVMTEPFSQWVVEDEFCAGRPALEEVGVQFVSDVGPHALLKTRLLNAAHSALGYLGVLAGHTHIHDAMADQAFAGYVERMMDDEIAPLLPAVPGVGTASYAGTVRARLRNPAVGDRLSRLCRNGSSKVPAHLLSSIREARASGRPHELLTLAVAGWCRYLRGTDRRGQPLELDDPLAGRLRALAVAGGTDPRPLLSERAVFGSLGAAPWFVASVARDLRDLEALGPRQVVAQRASERELVLAA
jgi:fructuronate reductase/mannitol 2-dehydrogenase